MDPQTMAQLQMYQQLFGNHAQAHPALQPGYPPTGGAPQGMAPNGMVSGLSSALQGSDTMPGLATALLMRRKKPPVPQPAVPQGAPSPDGGGDGASADPNTP